MTDTFRALCAEVLAFNNGESPYNFSGLNPYDRDNAAFDAWQDIRQRLKSALTQPQPEGPTESDVTELFYRYVGEGSEVGFENAIAEALARWGRPAIEPEPEGPTDEEIFNLALEHNISYSLIDGSVMRGDALSFARAVLSRWGRPEPEGSTDERAGPRRRWRVTHPDQLEAVRHAISVMGLPSERYNDSLTTTTDD
jgi:hypothetical protein